jgi:hypothetical protein
MAPPRAEAPISNVSVSLDSAPGALPDPGRRAPSGPENSLGAGAPDSACVGHPGYPRESFTGGRPVAFRLPEYTAVT